MMNSAYIILSQEQIKHRLVLLEDELIMLSEQPVWNELATAELEVLRTNAIAHTDRLWYAWRSLLATS